VEKDFAKALRWYRKAAEGGVVKALVTIGEIYRAVGDVPVNNLEAYKWYTIAAEKGHPQSAGIRSVVLAKIMTPEQTAEAERQARDWLEQHPRRLLHFQTRPQFTDRDVDAAMFVATPVGLAILAINHRTQGRHPARAHGGGLADAGEIS
jgi:hypothetical protein